MENVFWKNVELLKQKIQSESEVKEIISGCWEDWREICKDELPKEKFDTFNEEIMKSCLKMWENAGEVKAMHLVD